MSETPVVIDNFLPTEMFFNFAHTSMTGMHYRPCDFTESHEESDGSIDTFGENLATQKNFHESMCQALHYARTHHFQQVSDFYLNSFDTIQEIKKLLNIKQLWRLRTNCTFGQKEKHLGSFHVDTPDRGFHTPENKTAILYLNTNNGGTQFENSIFVESKANRCVVAPMTMRHAGVWTTNAKLRYVTNINYTEN